MIWIGLCVAETLICSRIDGELRPEQLPAAVVHAARELELVDRVDVVVLLFVPIALRVEP